MKTLLIPLLALMLGAAQPVPDPTPPEPPIPPPAAVDPALEGSRIVRGNKVAPGTAPWQVQIFTTVPIPPETLEEDRRKPPTDTSKLFLDKLPEWERDHLCGGALIGDGWVLTAAHCFVRGDESIAGPDQRRARLGSNQLTRATEMAVDRVVVHADYRNSGNKRHDIALIHLVPDAATNRQLLARARPVAIATPATRAFVPREMLRVTGWGITGERRSGATRSIDGKLLRGSPDLLEAELNVAPLARCRAIDSYKPIVWDGVICAVGDDTDQDTCQGDSGGPMLMTGAEGDVLVGVVSTGKGCGLKGVPGLYTRVASYADWIRAVTAAMPPPDRMRCRLQGRGARARLECLA